MPRTIPIIIGEVMVDLTASKTTSGPKLRLGGIVHAARGLWAAGQAYSVGAFCPAYLVDQARDYLKSHGCEHFILLGEISGAPNVVLISDVREVGHQGYEDILRDARVVTRLHNNPDLTPFNRAIIFPGRYELSNVLNLLPTTAQITIDAAYDLLESDILAIPHKRVETIVLSTSSPIFAEIARNSVTALLKLVKDIDADYLLLKENRGGSRLFNLASNEVEFVTATLSQTTNSVGVGDTFTAIYGSFDGSRTEAAWRGMQVATIYSQSTWPDDIRRDVLDEMNLPLNVVRNLGGISLPWHDRRSKQLYLAAPDFSYANHPEINQAIAALEYHNFFVRRPVKENGEVPEGTDLASLSTFYFDDVKLLSDCAAVFAIPIDRDPGTLVELGMAIQMGKPVITYDPREENRNTMVAQGSSTYSTDLDICLNGVFSALSKLRTDNLQ